MSSNESLQITSTSDPTTGDTTNPPVAENPDSYCPVCNAALSVEKCKVVCRSPTCVYRIVFNCSEF